MSTEEIDQRVSRRIAEARRTQGISLKAVARVVGGSYQQIRKYETGESRVTAGMLVRIAEALRVDPSFLLSGSVTVTDDALELVDVGALSKGLSEIRDETVRQRVFDLVVALRRKGV